MQVNEEKSVIVKAENKLEKLDEEYEDEQLFEFSLEVSVLKQKKQPRVLCLYVSLPEEISIETLDSIKQQTLQVQKIVMVTEKSNKTFVAARVCEVVNKELDKINLQEYDFILRVDSDVVLPTNFLEANLKTGLDVMGFGSAQIIRVGPFIKLMNGRLNSVSDDNYIHHKFIANGLTAGQPVIKAIKKRVSGAPYGNDYFIKMGEIQYRMGIEPLHELGAMKPNAESIFRLFGYFRALLTRKPLLDTAQYIRYRQLATIRNITRLRRGIRKRLNVLDVPRWVRGPVVLQLDTHNYCHMNCIYCNVEHLCNGKHGQMSVDIMRQAMTELKDIVSQVKLFLNGDPILEKRLPMLTAMSKEINPKAIVIIYTTASIYKNRHLLRDKNLDEVHVTFSANTPETYAKVHGRPLFQEALNTVAWLSKNKYPNQKIVMHFVVVGENFHELPEWKKRFAMFEQFIAPVHDSFNQKASKALLKKHGALTLNEHKANWPKNFVCGTCGNISVSYDGRILLCCDVPYSMSLGRVGEIKLMDAWRIKWANKMRNKACQQCNLRHPNSAEILDKYIR
jgi:hypothetical protein